MVTADSFKLSSLRNRIGIKGSIARIEYNFYANYNLLNYKYSLDSLKSNINENFIGGKLRFKKDKFSVNSSINLKTNGNYEFIGKINNKFLMLNTGSNFIVKSGDQKNAQKSQNARQKK